jgi:hypothetical protein
VFLKCLSPVNPFGATRYLRPFLNTSSCVELRPSTLYFSPERHPIPATAKEGPRCERTVYGSSLLLQIRSGVPVEKQKRFSQEECATWNRSTLYWIISYGIVVLCTRYDTSIVTRSYLEFFSPQSRLFFFLYIFSFVHSETMDRSHAYD